ncbi:MAG: NlpC/P60 family protein [Alphaproteobacteria bacterium]|nr:NlpC/P60 family protein [Alphaproteobacteria bacterium]
MNYDISIDTSTCTHTEHTLKKLNAHYPTQLISPYNEIQKRIPVVLNAQYKNPSNMRLDAPNFFSCSSLVSYLYRGIYIPSISIDKYLYVKNLKNIPQPKNKNDCVYGDMVFTNTGKGNIYYESVEYIPGTKIPEGIDHVGMYLTEDTVIHASRANPHGIEIQSYEKFLEISGTCVGYGRLVKNIHEPRYCISIPINADIFSTHKKGADLYFHTQKHILEIIN